MKFLKNINILFFYSIFGLFFKNIYYFIRHYILFICPISGVTQKADRKEIDAIDKVIFCRKINKLAYRLLIEVFCNSGIERCLNIHAAKIFNDFKFRVQVILPAQLFIGLSIETIKLQIDPVETGIS